MDTQLTLFGFPVSLIEMVGAVVGVIYLVLEYRANRWLWLFGALMPLFYIYINFKSGIYANGALNIYYLFASVYGAICWLRTARKEETGAEETHLKSLPHRRIAPVMIAVTVLTAVLALLLKVLGESTMAWLDGFTSALGVVGMLLMAKKYYQQWICWLIVNPLMVVLYLLHGNYPSMVMYLFYCLFATLGYLRWKRLYEEDNKKNSLKDNE